MAYPTDLSKHQLKLFEILIGDAAPKFRKHSLASIANALAYVFKGGIPWKLLPNDFPPPSTVFYHFKSFCERGIWASLLSALTKGYRGSIGLDPEPFQAVIDSQTCRSGLAQSEKGIDGNKRTNGIKRHLLVDEGGLPLAVHASTANCHDGKEGCKMLPDLKRVFPQIIAIKADMGYRGTFVTTAQDSHGICVECVKSNFGTDIFRPIRNRWVVERTFSWFDSFRRLCRNYEQKLSTATHMATACCAFFMLWKYR